MSRKKFESKIPNNWVRLGLMDLTIPEQRKYWKEIEELAAIVEDWPEWKKRACDLVDHEEAPDE